MKQEVVETIHVLDQMHMLLLCFNYIYTHEYSHRHMFSNRKGGNCRFFVFLRTDKSVCGKGHTMILIGF